MLGKINHGGRQPVWWRDFPPAGSGSGEAATETSASRITYCLEAVKTGLLKLPAFQFVGTIRDVPIEFTRFFED